MENHVRLSRSQRQPLPVERGKSTTFEGDCIEMWKKLRRQECTYSRVSSDNATPSRLLGCGK